MFHIVPFYVILTCFLCSYCFLTDIKRTYPENIFFRDVKNSQLLSLKNVLVAFAHHNTSVGYCQVCNCMLSLYVGYAGNIKNSIDSNLEPDTLGPVYPIPLSYERGTEMFLFGLPSTLYRFPIRHQMKAVA